MHRRSIVRAVTAVLLLVAALLSSAAVHALAQPRWYELLAGGGDVPASANTASFYAAWSDAAGADERARREGSVDVIVCGACEDDSWSVVYRFTLAPQSLLLEQFRTSPADETALVASNTGFGVPVRAGQMPPTMTPAVIRQDGPQADAVVEVRGEWERRPVAPVEVVFRRDFGNVYPSHVSLEVRTGDDLLVTEVTGTEPTAQRPDVVTLDGSGDDPVSVTLASRDAASSEVAAASSPPVQDWLNLHVTSLWVRFVALAPLVFVLVLLRRARGYQLDDVVWTWPLRAATAAGAVVAAAATVAVVTGWQISDLLEFAAARIVPGWENGPWNYSYGTGSGAALVLVAVGFHLVAVHVERLASSRSPVTVREAGLSLVQAASVALYFALALTLWALVFLADHRPIEYPEPTPTAALGTLALVTFCVPVMMAGAAVAALGRTALLPGAAVGMWIGLVAVVMPWTGFVGRPQEMVRYAAVGALMLVALLAIARLGVVLSSGRRLREHGWTTSGVVVLVVLAAIPVPAVATAYWSAGVRWDDAWVVPWVIAMVLPLVVALGVLRVTRDTVRSPDVPGTGPQTRLLAVALGALLLFSPTELTAYLPISYLTALALLWWFTLPARSAATADVLTTPDPADRADLVTRLVTAREAERVAARLRRGLDAKVESGDLTWAGRQSAIDEVLAAAVAARHGAPTKGLPLETAALGTHPRDPWGWAGYTTAVALVAGLPWIALSVPGLLEFADASGYGPLSTIVAALLTAVSWPALGLLYGLAYPLLRGRTGLTKSLTMFVTVAVPAAVTLLLGSTAPDAWRSFLYLASQQLIVCLVLGMATEAELLRLAGRPLSDLTAVHNVRAIVAWVSGLVAAIATATATAVVTGVTALVVGILAPQGVENPSPPPERSVSSSADTAAPATLR